MNCASSNVLVVVSSVEGEEVEEEGGQTTEEEEVLPVEILQLQFLRSLVSGAGQQPRTAYSGSERRSASASTLGPTRMRALNRRYTLSLNFVSTGTKHGSRIRELGWVHCGLRLLYPPASGSRSTRQSLLELW